MYTYKVSSEDTQRVKELADSQDMDNLKTKIDNLNKSFESYSTQVPSQQSFDRLEQINVSDEELEKQARDSLASYRAENINKIVDDTASTQSKLESDINSLKISADTQKQNIASTYAQAKEDLGNDALKRGLAFSSIVVNNMNALTQDELNKYAQIDNEVTSKINAINFQISAIDRQKENALNDFDIEYAVKLEGQLSSLKEKLAAKQLEITKYNNEIAKLENDYNIKYATLQNTLDKESWDKEYDLAKLAGQYGVGMLDKYKLSRVYSLVKDYLSNFSSSEAKAILQNSDYLKGILGNKYSTLLGEL